MGFLIPAVRASEVPDSCPVTKVADQPFIPPAPYPSVRNAWIGSAKLWTFVPAESEWEGVVHDTPGESQFSEKLFWWSEGYDWRKENPPELKITGKRLDGPAPPLTAAEHANAGWTNDREHPFMVTLISIPKAGCWQITGQYKGKELSYVVWVSGECSANDLLGAIKPDDPAYTHAMELAETLRGHGFIVRCIGQSKWNRVFEGQKGAALFKTDQGDFEALFLPKSQTFELVESIERREKERFLYSFQGYPRPMSAYPLDGRSPIYFAKHANQFFITWAPDLAVSIVKAVS
jgi:hypothetical protein